MTPSFPRIERSIRFTLEYYEIGRVKAHIDILSGKDTSPSFVDLMETYLKRVFRLHEEMEDEINQTIYTSKPPAIAEMFDGPIGLKAWANDYRIEQTNTQYIEGIVDNYNDKLHKDLILKVEREVEKFTSTDKYINLKHLEEYEYQQPAMFMLGSHFRAPQKYTDTYKRFYVIEDKPEYIDTFFLPNYFETLDSIIGNFRNIIGKYITRYKNGHIIDTSSEPIQPSLPPSVPTSKKAAPQKKMGVNMSAKELVLLFKLLHELKPEVFEVKSNQELYKFIAEHFTTKATRGGTLSIGKMRTLFNEVDNATIDAWITRLQIMLDRAKKLK